MRAAQPHLNAEELGSCVLFLPTTIEQTAIVNYLNAKAARLDALTVEAGKAISLLQERRSALISAAVTGQIDVRGLAPKEAA
jgi:type I restriction enzyme S subunit